MDTVRMYHPTLEAERDFPASAVPHHRLAGWKPVSEREQAAASAEPEKAQAPAPSPAARPADPPKNTSGAARPAPAGSAD